MASQKSETLGEDEIHLWHAWLDQPVERVEQLAQTLSADEAARAARFHFERDRRRFIVARGWLRTILGQYLNTAPTDIQFCYGPHGKPCLAGQSLSNHLQFNLAHSDEIVLYALAQNHAIGVDIEHIRPVPDLDQIATRYFSTRERAALRMLPPEQQQEGFFNGWTRKEAYLKALGDGLTRPLDGFDVSLTPGEAARLLDVAHDPKEAARWFMYALMPCTGYVSAVVAPVVEGQAWRVQCREWTDPLIAANKPYGTLFNSLKM